MNAVSFSDVVNIINILSLSRLPVHKVKEPRKQHMNIVTSQGKAKPTPGNVHSRAVVGIMDPSRTCGSASALIPRYSIELILQSLVSPGIFSPGGFILLRSQNPGM